MSVEQMGVIVGMLGVMIPLASVVLGIGVAFWAIYWHHRSRRMQYEERRLMIEKGMTPPPVLPTGERRRWTPEDCLRWGTILLFLGIGLLIAHLLVRASGSQDPVLGVAGAIVGLLGLGNLVYYFIARDRQHSEPIGRP